ncbi:MAG: hypothetical protein N2376_06685, partial [Clostridia bacterium]|nr:hypothetical protein [Clostridia bacterium]
MIKLFITNTKGTIDITSLAPTITWAGDYQQCARTLDFGLVSSPTDKNVPVIGLSLIHISEP